jgi:hypothetical protein
LTWQIHFDCFNAWVTFPDQRLALIRKKALNAIAGRFGYYCPCNTKDTVSSISTNGRVLHSNEFGTDRSRAT